MSSRTACSSHPGYTVRSCLKEEINKNFGDEKEKQRELDLLKYQNREIEASKLKKDEEENLEAKRKVILNSEKIANNLIDTSTQISDIAIEAISNAVRSLEKISTLDNKYENSLNTLKSIYYDIQEFSRDIDEYKGEAYFEEEEREKVENRLDLIYMLKRKYGNSIDEILNYNDELKNRINKIENSEEYVNFAGLFDKIFFTVCSKEAVKVPTAIKTASYKFSPAPKVNSFMLLSNTGQVIFHSISIFSLSKSIIKGLITSIHSGIYILLSVTKSS